MKKLLIFLMSLSLTANLTAWKLTMKNYTTDPLEVKILYGSPQKCVPDQLVKEGEKQLQDERGAAEEIVQIAASKRGKPEVYKHEHRCCLTSIMVKKMNGKGEGIEYKFEPVSDGNGFSCRSNIVGIYSNGDSSLRIEKKFKDKSQKKKFQDGLLLVIDNRTKRELMVQTVNHEAEITCEGEQFGVKANEKREFQLAAARGGTKFFKSKSKCFVKYVFIRTSDKAKPSGIARFRVSDKLFKRKGEDFLHLTVDINETSGKLVITKE